MSTLSFLSDPSSPANGAEPPTNDWLDEREAKDPHNLLAELVQSESIRPALKAIFERGWQRSYRSVLNRSIAAKREQIQEACNTNHEEFIGMVDQLLAMKLDVQDLKHEIVELNKSVQVAGMDVVEETALLSDYRYMVHNLQAALGVASRCQRLVNAVAKAQQQTNEGKYFAALKTLDQLQRTHLPYFKEYEFTERISNYLPVLAARIRDRVQAKFTAWLNAVRDQAQTLGDASLSHMDSVVIATEEKRRQIQIAGSAAMTGDHSASAMATAAAAVVAAATPASARLDDSVLFERCGVSLVPLYQCLHVYEQMKSTGVGSESSGGVPGSMNGDRERAAATNEFRELYWESRRQHAQQAIDLPPMNSTEFQRYYPGYFARIIGFFIIEHSIFKSGNELLSRSQIDSLWAMALTRLKSALGEQMRRLRNVDLLLGMKYAVVLFCFAAEAYGYNASPLLHFLTQLSDTVESTLVARLAVSVKQTLVKDKCEPLVVPDARVYDERVLAFELQDPSINVAFPASMPFSGMVPDILTALQQFAKDYYDFARYLPVNLDSKIHDAVDEVISSVIGPELVHFAEDAEQSSSLHISQAVQYSVNASYLCEACRYLEVLLATLAAETQAIDEAVVEGPLAGTHVVAIGGSSATVAALGVVAAGGSMEAASAAVSSRMILSPSLLAMSGADVAAAAMGPSLKVVSLESRSVFQMVRARFEGLIFELVDSKIDSFMTLSEDFAWTPSSPADQPSDYVEDLVNYLETTFMCMMFMNDAVREAIHFTTCKHICTRLIDMWQNVKHFNLIAVYNLHQDLLVLESFAARCPIDNLAETFAELRQLITLFTSGDPQLVLDPHTRQTRFPLLSNTRLVRIMSRFKDIGMFASLPAGAQRVKRKAVDAVVKKLKAMD